MRHQMRNNRRSTRPKRATESDDGKSKSRTNVATDVSIFTFAEHMATQLCADALFKLVASMMYS